MGQALYRKYRSRSLDEIVGQDHVTQTLQQAIKQGRVSHAYLLTGPRGVGKTSIARILAHEINKIPYTDDSTHIDIIEIDAASNRRIDEIRDLRDKVNIAPTSAKYKVYIIDEVHMLTKEAFNALLKTLEEPPAHVVFILATTDAHKLPETIISRTQRFSFKPVEKAKVIEHLKLIAKTEKLQVSDEALDLLAEHGEGSFRDSISLLDQASNQSGKLELSDVQRLLGIPPQQSIDDLLGLITTGGNSASLISQLESLYNQGYQAALIAKQLSRQLRLQLANQTALLDSGQILGILSQLLAVPAAHDPERFLEIALLQSLPKRPVDLLVTKPTTVDEPVEKKAEKPQPAKKQPAEQVKFDVSIWPDILAQLKAKHNTLYGIVRMAEPTFTDNTVSLAFAFAFHQKRASEGANRQRMSDIIKDLTGETVDIECILEANTTPPKLTVVVEKPGPNESLSTISNIFGEAELLES
jgi:DNA polymerase-3 subunit gamma/tau